MSFEFRAKEVGGEVEALDAVAEFLAGVFVEAETEAGHIDVGTGEAWRLAGNLEEGLLVGQAEVAEAEDGADVVHVAVFLENGYDGEVLGAADVDADIQIAELGVRTSDWVVRAFARG